MHRILSFASFTAAAVAVTCVVGVFFVSSPVARAQTSSKAVVAVEAAGPSSPAPADSTCQAIVSLHIKSGFHINARKPTEDYLIATDLVTTPPDGLKVVKTVYPPAKFDTFSFSPKPLAVYEGAAVITLSVKVGAEVAAGSMTIPGKLTFQACNDSQCLPPATVDVAIPVDVAAAAAKSDQSLTITGAPPNASVSVDGRAVGRANSSGRFVGSYAPGTHRVRVEQDGFEAWEKAIVLAADAPQTVAVSLQTSTSAPEATPSTPASSPSSAAPASPVAAPAVPAASEPPPSRLPYVVGGAVVVLLAAVGAVVASRSKRVR